MSSNYVDNLMYEMVESALYPREEDDSVRAMLNNSLEKGENELHEALFCLLMRSNTKEGLAHLAAFHLCERAEE